MAIDNVIQGQRQVSTNVTANLKPDIMETLFLIEPYATPIMQSFFFSDRPSKEVINKFGKFSHFEDEYLAHQLPILSTLGSPTGTTLTANATTVDGWEVLKINDLVLVEETEDQGVVTATDSTSATITNQQSGANTSPGNFTQATLGSLKVIGNAVFEGSGTVAARSTQEVEVFNYLTMMSETVKNTGRDEAGLNYTDGLTHEEQVIKKIKEMKLGAERLIIYSEENGYESAADGTIRSFGKGLRSLITTNVQEYTGSYTETLLRTILQSVARKGSYEKTLYAGIGLYDALQGIFGDKRGEFNEVVSKKLGVNVMTYEFGGVTLNLIKEPVLDGRYDDDGIIIDEGRESIKYRYMRSDSKGSRKFRMRIVDDAGTETETTKLFMDFGIQLVNEETCGLIVKTDALS